MPRKPVRRGAFARTYFMPAVIAVISVAGLLFALMGDGAWDYLSWLALGFPVVIGIWFSVRRNDRLGRHDTPCQRRGNSA